MERLAEHRGRPIMISEINDSFKKEMLQYYKEEEYSINTAHKELSITKSFCKYAQRKGLAVHHELYDLKIKNSGLKPIYWTISELDQIEKISFKRSNLEIARDWLIISCFTGQRILDFITFNVDMIREEKGTRLIEFKQKKTQKLMTIPIHPKVQVILDKRQGQFPPAQKDQKYNLYIKEICKLAGIDKKVEGKKIVNVKGEPKKNSFRRKAGMFPKHELVSSHIGRRSFATNFYGKIPTPYLINVTGHSSEAIFLNYIGKSNKDIAVAITNYF